MASKISINWVNSMPSIGIKPNSIYIINPGNNTKPEIYITNNSTGLFLINPNQDLSGFIKSINNIIAENNNIELSLNFINGILSLSGSNININLDARYVQLSDFTPWKNTTNSRLDSLESAITDGLKTPQPFNASTTSVWPTANKGTTYKVTVAGTTSGVVLEVGDTIIYDTTGNTPFVVQSNIDQATTTVKGLVAIATQAEVDAGAVTNKVVVPSTLSSRLTSLLTSITASQTEVDAGTVDNKFITPLKNKTYFDSRKASQAEVNDGNNDTKFVTPLTLNNVITNKANINADNINVIAWQDALDLYNKTQINDKFFQNGRETLTVLGQPTLVGNICYIRLTAENSQEQVVSVDLSGIATFDIHTDGMTYNAATNILTITDNDSNEFSVDLSEFSILHQTDSGGITTLTQEGIVKLTVSKVGQSGSYNDLLNKPDLTVYATVEQLNNKLDKPTTDGSWVITKSGSTITYTDASTFGQNIANTNLTWSADRTQNLNSKKLSFTGGRVSVPALELEITAENSVPNKIWTAGTYLWHTNNLGISYRVAYDNQVIKTISDDVTLDDTYHNCIVRVTATCKISVPAGLRSDFNCVFDAIGSIIATFSVVSGSGITISNPFGLKLRNNAMCTLYKTSSVNFRLNGGLLPV